MIASAFAGCVKQLPPAAMPEPITPAVQTPGPPPAGTGRLIIDVVDGPTIVNRITMEATPTQSRGRQIYRFFESPAVLCNTTPCVADVPVGNVLLSFPVVGDTNDTETELVYVSEEPSVYRRALSIYTNKTGATRVLGIIMTAVGGASLMTGTALLPIGISKDNNAMTWAGGISLGAGAALLTLGIIMIRADSPTFSAGASNHFAPN